MRFRYLVVSSVFLANPVFALAQVSPASGPSSELLVSDTRRKVTDEVKRFLEERCAQQCDVGEVTVKVAKRKAPVGSTPGFEELQPESKDFVVERVDVDLMLDKRLTNDFRSGVRALVAKKLDAQGLPNALHESLIHFPTAQELPDHVQPPPQWPQQPPAAKTDPDKKTDPLPQPPLQQIQPPERSVLDRLIDVLPLLLGLLLCAAVVWFTLRQYQRLLDARVGQRIDGEDPTKQQAERQKVDDAASLARRELDKQVEALKARLMEQRPLTREVARDLLANGAPADAALAVAMVGPAILDGVRHDPESRTGLRALDGYLAERSPPDSLQDRKRVIADLERRLLRAQVAHGEAPEESAFAFLRSVPMALFVRVLPDETPEAQALILKYAPPALVQGFVERQPPSVRQRLVLPLLERTATPRHVLAEVAARFRERVAGHSVPAATDGVRGATGATDPVGDLLQAAPPAERKRLLLALRGDPDALRTALGSFVADETLPSLDDEVLATAMARLDPATAAMFADSLDEAARKRLLAALPAVTAQSIAEEAGVLTASPQRRATARRVALAAIRQAMDERGLDLAEINRHLVPVVGAGEVGPS